MKLICSDDLGLIEDFLETTPYDEIIELNENYDSIILSIGQMDIFSYNDDRKIYCLKDVKNKFSTKPDKDLEEFLEHLKDLKIDIIFYSIIKEPNKKYFDYFDNENVYVFKKLNRLTIKNYIKKLCEKYNLKIDEKIFNFLSTMLPLDSLLIKNELFKISFLDKNDLTLDNIQKIIITDINESVFILVNNFFEKKHKEIIKQIRYFENIKMDFIDIFNILIHQIFNLKLYCLHYQQYKSINKILNDFQLQRFQLEKQIRIIENVDLNCIDNFLKILLKLNLDFMNSSKNLEIELKTLLLNGDEYGI